MRNFHYDVYYRVLLALLLSLVSLSTYSRECQKETDSTTINPPDLVIPKNTPINSALGSELPSRETLAYSCTGMDATSDSGEAVGVKAYGNYVATINNRRIYSTNIDGVGYAVFGVDNSYCINNKRYVSGLYTIDGNEDNTATCYIASVFSGPYKGTIGVQFYKYKEKTGSGIVNGKHFGSFIYRTNNRSRWVFPESIGMISSFHVNSLSCELMDSVTDVDMGIVTNRNFSGVGSFPSSENTKDVNIKLNCDSGDRLHFRVLGVINDADKGVLSTKAGGAEGVGIQLLYNGDPLPLGKDMQVNVTSDGVYNLPLKARYYQTQQKITKGPVNASATIELSFY